MTAINISLAVAYEYCVTITHFKSEFSLVLRSKTTKSYKTARAAIEASLLSRRPVVNC